MCDRETVCAPRNERVREKVVKFKKKKKKKRERAVSSVGLSARKDAVYPLSLTRPKGKCKVVQTMINELYCGSFK